MDDKNGGSPVLYFTALFLTGQLERAIEVLHRSDMAVFSTHIAILCYTLKMIILTKNVRDEILVTDPGNVVDSKINFAKLIILYVKRFELVNVNYSLTYCYFLHQIQLEFSKDKSSGSLFDACVSRLVYVTGERDAILGKLTPDNNRIPGLLDKIAHGISVKDVIAKVALDTSLNGDNIGACIIYCIAKKPNEAVMLMNRQLSNCIASISDVAERAVKLAERLVERYSVQNSEVEKQNISTLKSLIQCYCIFRLAGEKRYEEVILEAEKLSIIPLNPDIVSNEVENFKFLAEEVRTLLPELCLTLMTSIVENYNQAAPRSPTQEQMKLYAKAILLYSAMVPHRFPTSIASKLLQLQTQVS